LKPWRALVTAATVDAVAAQGFQAADGAWAVYAVFTLPRPAAHWRTGRHTGILRDAAPAHPATLPDLDKLLRSALDALVDGGALTNDARVVHLSADKVYPGGHPDALDSPGAVLLLREW
jgi:hypothetical protein